MLFLLGRVSPRLRCGAVRPRRTADASSLTTAAFAPCSFSNRWNRGRCPDFRGSQAIRRDLRPNVGIEKDTADSISAAFEPEVRTRARRDDRANSGFAALVK